MTLVICCALSLISVVSNAASLTNKEFSQRIVAATIEELEDDLMITGIEVRRAPVQSKAVRMVNIFGRLRGTCFAKGYFVFNIGLENFKASENPLADLVCK